MGRTRICDESTRHGLLAKAAAFLEQAQVVLTLAQDEVEVADAAVTLLVHAGIAAADVICCAPPRRARQGESHTDAIALLRTADRDAAKHLTVLLGLKTQVGYSALRTTSQNLRRASRAASHLVDAAQQAS